MNILNSNTGLVVNGIDDKQKKKLIEFLKTAGMPFSFNADNNSFAISTKSAEKTKTELTSLLG